MFICVFEPHAEAIRSVQVLTAVLAHGHVVGVFLQDEERLTHGSSALIEMLVQTIEEIKPRPAHLILQTDNTTALSKNSQTHVWLSQLVGMKLFATCTANYMQKGHTHEDVDRFMGELLPVMRRRSWQSIGELQKVLEDALIQRGQHLKEKIMVKELKTVRDWSAWLDPLDVKLSNTFRGRKKRNEDEDPMITGHSFSYKRLGDLTQQERGKVRPRRDHSDDDVYCILKARMHHDASDAHAPVLVLPADRVNRVGPASSLHNIPQVELSGDRIKKLGLLVGLLKKYSYPIGATAIEELVNQKDEDLEVPLVTWLDEPGVARMHNLVFGGNQYWPHLPEVCFPLLAMMK